MTQGDIASSPSVCVTTSLKLTSLVCFLISKMVTCQWLKPKPFHERSLPWPHPVYQFLSTWYSYNITVFRQHVWKIILWMSVFTCWWLLRRHGHANRLFYQNICHCHEFFFIWLDVILHRCMCVYMRVCMCFVRARMCVFRFLTNTVLFGSYMQVCTCCVLLRSYSSFVQKESSKVRWSSHECAFVLNFMIVFLSH